MSYTALYRKFRPANFDEVKGQEHIVRTLKNQILQNRVGHAYLFCGTRGTGKTSVAKVFAKAVNCENPSSIGPCGVCPVCKEIAAGNSMNVIEIDAASNNGVDNIRQIKEEVAYPPTKGKYKVYIIDEVHMLSIGAFNALLKTLEEPPSYVIFILATTEAHKIPITIMSRCQRYDFKRITKEVLADHLMDLMKQEAIEYEQKAVIYIARQADGSMRDALSLLDECIAFNYGEKLTFDKVLSILGTVDINVFFDLAEAVYKADAARTIEIVGDVVSYGRELSQFIPDFIWYLRNLMLVGISDNMEEVLDVTADKLNEMKKQAQELDTEFIMQCINKLSDLTAVLRTSNQKRIMTEICFIRLCRPEMKPDSDSLLERIRHLEQKIEELENNGGFVPSSQSQKTEDSVNLAIEDENIVIGPTKTFVPQNVLSEKRADAVEKPMAAVERPQVSGSINGVLKNWKKISGKLMGSEKDIIACATIMAEDEKTLRITFARENEFFYNYATSCNMANRISDIIKKETGLELVCHVVLSEKNSNRDDNDINKLKQIVNIPIEIE